MAVKLHPDQNKDDPNANEKFQELGSFSNFQSKAKQSLW